MTYKNKLSEAKQVLLDVVRYPLYTWKGIENRGVRESDRGFGGLVRNFGGTILWLSIGTFIYTGIFGNSDGKNGFNDSNKNSTAVEIKRNSEAEERLRLIDLLRSYADGNRDGKIDSKEERLFRKVVGISVLSLGDEISTKDLWYAELKGKKDFQERSDLIDDDKTSETINLAYQKNEDLKERRVD